MLVFVTQTFCNLSTFGYNIIKITILGEKMRKTKILATIGPACNNYKTLKEMVLAGLNGVRINFSHGSIEKNQVILDLAKQIRSELNVPLSIVVDTRGPEVRVRTFESGKIILKKGQTFSFTNQTTAGDQTKVGVTKPVIFKALKVGAKVLACDGLISLRILEVSDSEIKCKVLAGGEISDNKGLFFPGVKYNFDYLNDADKSDIIWAIKNGADYIAGSFVNSAEDVLALKDLVKKHDGKQEIIAKIESKAGLKNLDEIINVADGIMVARGDLGVELPLQTIPKWQREIIEKTMLAGKFVITATEMLASMQESIRPTRAEVSDVANAVLQGTSTIMLSGETAVGKYPVEAVKTMAQIAETCEKDVKRSAQFNTIAFKPKNTPDIISHSAVSTSFGLNAKAIVVLTNSGNSAKLISRFKPNCPIVAVTDEEQVFQKCGLIGGVTPILRKIPYGKVSEIFKLCEDCVVSQKLAKPDDYIVVSSASRHMEIDTDFVKIIRI